MLSYSCKYLIDNIVTSSIMKFVTEVRTNKGTMSKSPSLRRIMADIRELSIDPSDQYHAAPLENDMFEWHFTIRGAKDTDFAGGTYHGRILLPPEYPFKPPDIIFMTPSGRFETNMKVCLSFSAHHPELWQPAWGIRLILEALIGFLPTPADGALGSLDWTSKERKRLAMESSRFRCPHCCSGMVDGGDGMRMMTCADLIPPETNTTSTTGIDGVGGGRTRYRDEIEKLKMLQFQNHAVLEDGGRKKDEGAKKDDDGDGGGEEGDGLADIKSVHDVPGLVEGDGVSGDAKKSAPMTLSLDSMAEQVATSSVPGTGGESPLQRSDDLTQQKSPPPAEVASADVPPTTAIPPVGDSMSPSSVAVVAESPTVAAGAHDDPDRIDRYLVSDGVLHGLIGFFSVVVIALLRQAQSLVDELYGLDEGSGHSEMEGM
jgi:ubiquitin-protein ligase